MPVSSTASVLFGLSQRVKPEQAGDLSKAARATADKALAIDGADPLAQEILRMLEDDGPSPLHRLKPEAVALANEAESLFARRRFPEALARYDAVMRLDPQYSPAWVGACDCHYLQKDWARVEDKGKGRRSAWDIELDAWRTALKVADELRESTGKPLSDPALLQFGQAYRPALDAWTAAHPGFVRTFIERYGIQP